MNDSSVAEQAEALRALQQHPGWQVLVAHMQKQLAVAMTEMRSAAIADAVAKATHKYLAIQDFIDAPRFLEAHFNATLKRK